MFSKVLDSELSHTEIPTLAGVKACLTSEMNLKSLKPHVFALVMSDEGALPVSVVGRFIIIPGSDLKVT